MLNLTHTPMTRVDLLIAEGTINSETAPQFEQALEERLDKGTSNLILDLEQVDYMSSAGLRAMVAAYKRAKSQGGTLVLAAPSDRVREVLDLGGLIEVFPIYEDRLSAVGSF